MPGWSPRRLAGLPPVSKAALMGAFDDAVTDRSLRLADLRAAESQPAAIPPRGIASGPCTVRWRRLSRSPRGRAQVGEGARREGWKAMPDPTRSDPTSRSGSPFTEHRDAAASGHDHGSTHGHGMPDGDGAGDVRPPVEDPM